MNNFISIANPQRELSKIPKFYEDFNKQLKSGVFVGGKNLDLLEKSLANFLKVNYCSTLNSGTDALILSLIALDIGPGDEVIVPCTTMSATAMCPIIYGGIPVFADIDEEYFCIDLESVKSKISSKTKAIIAKIPTTATPPKLVPIYQRTVKTIPIIVIYFIVPIIS